MLTLPEADPFGTDGGKRGEQNVPNGQQERRWLGKSSFYLTCLEGIASQGNILHLQLACSSEISSTKFSFMLRVRLCNVYLFEETKKVK